MSLSKRLANQSCLLDKSVINPFLNTCTTKTKPRLFIFLLLNHGLKTASFDSVGKNGVLKEIETSFWTGWWDCMGKDKRKKESIGLSQSDRSCKLTRYFPRSSKLCLHQTATLCTNLLRQVQIAVYFGKKTNISQDIFSPNSSAANCIYRLMKKQISWLIWDQAS